MHIYQDRKEKRRTKPRFDNINANQICIARRTPWIAESSIELRRKERLEEYANPSLLVSNFAAAIIYGTGNRLLVCLRDWKEWSRG
jgi:hypothetical protein